VQKQPKVGGVMRVAHKRTWQGDVERDEGRGSSESSKRTSTVSV